MSKECAICGETANTSNHNVTTIDTKYHKGCVERVEKTYRFCDKHSDCIWQIENNIGQVISNGERG